MAGIDKTYTNSYKDYKEFKDWAANQIITFFDGTTECAGDWVWDYEKEDFDNGEIPIMNTPTWLDYYFIKNCKIRFVVERMKLVYGKEFELMLKDKRSFKDIPRGCEQNRKITIHNANGCKYPFKKKLFNTPIDRNVWWIQARRSSNNMWFNYETYKWVNWNFLYPHNTNTQHFKGSTKSLIRFFRKQYLPKGIEFELRGRYIGENYIIKIK